MLAGNCVASGQNLRLHRAGNVHEVNAAAAGLRRLWRRRDDWFFSAPGAKNFFDGAKHGGRIKITDHQ